MRAKIIGYMDIDPEDVRDDGRITEQAWNELEQNRVYDLEDLAMETE